MGNGALIILRNRLVDVRRIVVDELTPQWMRSDFCSRWALNLDPRLRLSQCGSRSPATCGWGRIPDNGWGNFGTNIYWVRGEDVYRAISQFLPRRSDRQRERRRGTRRPAAFELCG